MGSEKHIGSAKKSLKEVINLLDKKLKIIIPLIHHGSGKPEEKGFIQFEGVLSLLPSKGKDEKKQEASRSSKTIDNKGIYPDKSEKIKFIVTSFVAGDLVNTGTSLDKQDPCLEIRIGKRTFVTERQKDAGTTAKFIESFEFTFSVEDFENELTVSKPNFLLFNSLSPLQAEFLIFHEKVTGERTRVGEGVGILPKLFSKFNQPTQARIELTYTKEKQTISKGYVDFVGILSLNNEKLNQSLIPRDLLKISPEFKDSSLRLGLSSMQVHALPDTGHFYDKQVSKFRFLGLKTNIFRTLAWKLLFLVPERKPKGDFPSFNNLYFSESFFS